MSRSKRIRKALAAAGVRQDGPKTWFALQLWSGEKWSTPRFGLEWPVCQAARRLGFEAWYPFYATDEIGEKILSTPTVLAHIPGYVFIRSAPWQSLGAVRRISGVNDLVREGADPRPIPDALINGIRGIFAEYEDHPLEIEPERYSDGDIAPVIEGPFAGFDATITGLAKKGKISVLVSIFGRVVGVSLLVQQLGPVKHRSLQPQKAA